jgi:hypothetical protein
MMVVGGGESERLDEEEAEDRIGRACVLFLQICFVTNTQCYFLYKKKIN